MTEGILSAREVTKAYPGVQALLDVDLTLRPGEVHALMGENGSGKSTLMSVIAGSQPPDSGRVLIDGVEHAHLNPVSARRLGVALVQQELTLAPDLSVGENVMMGRLDVRGGIVGWRTVHRHAQRYLDMLGVPIHSTQSAGSLSTSRQQMVEIARALSIEPRVLLLDEATSSLGEDDVAVLMGVIRRLRDKGVAIAFISHRMKEVFAIADHVTVLRDGSVVESAPISAFTERGLVAKMVGRNLDTFWHKEEVAIGEPVLSVSNLTRGPLTDVSIEVRRGEIVGLAGLVGSGRSALMRTLAGTRRVKPGQGTVQVAGRAIRLSNPRGVRANGLGYVPEDRKREGLVLEWSVDRNLSLTRMNFRPALSVLGRRFDRDSITLGTRDLTIKAPSWRQPIRTLSGGNQQKVLLARELANDPQVLLLDEPTRGVDVGAKEDIYTGIAALVRQGRGLLIASSELQELIGLCDRIYVFHGGRVVAELPRSEATEEAITYHSSGAHESETKRTATEPT